MNILAIDTTRDRLLVVLIKDENFKIFEGEQSKKGHSSSLLPCVDSMMEEYGLLPENLDAVCAVTGPGSFTGIRIGVATANAIAFGANAKRIDVNSFEILAYGQKGKVFCQIPALHGNVYGAYFEDGKMISKDFVEKENIPESGKIVKQENFVDFAFGLEDIVRQKWEAKEFVDQLRPMYLRKSQAEREKDAN